MKKNIITNTKNLLMFFGFIAILLLAYFLNFRNNNKNNFLLYKVKHQDISEIVKVTGEVFALEIVDVGAQVSGQVIKLNIKLGQSVQKGELIAEIDSATQLNELHTSNSELESTKALLISKKTSLKIAKARYERNLIMFNASAVSKETLETAEDNFRQAQSSVEALIWKIKQLQISVKIAQTNLGYTKIRSPLSGTIVSLPIEKGQTINFSQSTPLIAKIANLDKMEIRLQIPESDYTKIKAGMPVQYSTLSNPLDIKTSSILSIDPALVSLSQGSYNLNNNTDKSNLPVYYYARFNVNNSDRKLSIGMTTQNNILVKFKKYVLVIPKISINQNMNGSFVRIINKKNIVEERKVVTGIQDNNNIEVISGLKSGDNIIVSSNDKENN